MSFLPSEPPKPKKQKTQAKQITDEDAIHDILVDPKIVQMKRQSDLPYKIHLQHKPVALVIVGRTQNMLKYLPQWQDDKEVVYEAVVALDVSGRPEVASLNRGISSHPTAFQFAPEDPALFEHPFCVLIGDGTLPPVSDEAVQQIQRFLSYGGFLLIDDASGTPGGGFEGSVRELCSRVFPTRPLSPLPRDHSIFRSFFLLDSPVGRVANSTYLEGVEVGPMTPLVFCPNDLSGALERSPDGRNRYPVTPGGERQRQEAVKLGINLVMYSLTSRYKHDQAHVKRLMEEGRLP